MIGWRDDWATTEYQERLRDERDILRVRIRVEGGSVARFVAQYEAVIRGQTFALIRYDNAHGFPHRDTLDWQGRVVEKLPLHGMSNAEALNEGIAAIKTNWRAYRMEFLRRER